MASERWVKFHLLAGANMGPAKLAKAEKMGIKIINEEEFLNILAE